MVLALLLAVPSAQKQKQCTDIDIEKSNLDVTAFGGAKLCCHICNTNVNKLCCPSKDKNGDVRRSSPTAHRPSWLMRCDLTCADYSEAALQG